MTRYRTFLGQRGAFSCRSSAQIAHRHPEIGWSLWRGAHGRICASRGTRANAWFMQARRGKEAAGARTSFEAHSTVLVPARSRCEAAWAEHVGTALPRGKAADARGVVGLEEVCRRECDTRKLIGGGAPHQPVVLPVWEVAVLSHVRGPFREVPVLPALPRKPLVLRHGSGNAGGAETGGAWFEKSKRFETQRSNGRCQLRPIRS